MRTTATVLGLILGAGFLLTACEDADEIEITGPALEEVLAATQVTSDETPEVRIHGTSLGEPLIFINGVLMSEETRGLLENDIRPDDIEKVQVLKGEKALELYGPDAKDGVILITLKEGARKK